MGLYRASLFAFCIFLCADVGFASKAFFCNRGSLDEVGGFCFVTTAISLSQNTTYQIKGQGGLILTSSITCITPNCLLNLSFENGTITLVGNNAAIRAPRIEINTQLLDLGLGTRVDASSQANYTHALSRLTDYSMQGTNHGSPDTPFPNINSKTGRVEDGFQATQKNQTRPLILKPVAGAHGGMGGVCPPESGDDARAPYGSIEFPTHPGERGSCETAGDYTLGGGTISIILSGDLRNSGEISANGQSSVGRLGPCGAAAGGSIFISSPAIEKLGSIKAEGGAAQHPFPSGAGGRVSISTNAALGAPPLPPSAPGSPLAAVRTRGGLTSETDGAPQCADGGAGTLFVRTTDTSLFVDNAGRILSQPTLIDLPSFDHIHISNGAVAMVPLVIIEEASQESQATADPTATYLVMDSPPTTTPEPSSENITSAPSHVYLLQAIKTITFASTATIYKPKTTTNGTFPGYYIHTPYLAMETGAAMSFYTLKISTTSLVVSADTQILAVEARGSIDILAQNIVFKGSLQTSGTLTIYDVEGINFEQSVSIQAANINILSRPLLSGGALFHLHGSISATNQVLVDVKGSLSMGSTAAPANGRINQITAGFGRLTIQTTGYLTCSSGILSARYVSIDSEQSISVQKNCSVNADGFGMIPDPLTAYLAPQAGGSYGGVGASCRDLYKFEEVVIGNPINPESLGRPGFFSIDGNRISYPGSGGGLVNITTSQVLTISGIVSSNGGDGFNGGAGSGGTIRITADSIFKNDGGLIQAKGGSVKRDFASEGGGGGGGRIWINAGGSIESLVSMNGGYSSCGTVAGSGTVFDHPSSTLILKSDIVSNFPTVVEVLCEQSVSNLLVYENGWLLPRDIQICTQEQFVIYSNGKVQSSERDLHIRSAFVEVFTNAVLRSKGNLKVDGPLSSQFILSQSAELIVQRDLLLNMSVITVEGFIEVGGTLEVFSNDRPQFTINSIVRADYIAVFSKYLRIEGLFVSRALYCVDLRKMGTLIWVQEGFTISSNALLAGGSIQINATELLMYGLITTTGAGCGPDGGWGTGMSVDGAPGGGGGHGGIGGSGVSANAISLGGAIYDDPYSPRLPGSAGGGRSLAGYGGGVVFIEGRRLVQLDGFIECNGDQGEDAVFGDSTSGFGGGGGSGGGIVITTPQLVGRGLLTCEGGNGGYPGGGGGGGGLIHFERTSDIAPVNPFIGSYSINGGLGADIGECGLLGALTSTPCPLGRGGVFCIVCPVGFYNDGSTLDCQECTNAPLSSSYTLMGSPSATCPYTCDNGYYGSNCETIYEAAIDGYGGDYAFFSGSAALALILCATYMLQSYRLKRLEDKLRSQYPEILAPLAVNTRLKLRGEELDPVAFDDSRGLKSTDIRYHVCRIYFSGMNTPKSPWVLDSTQQLESLSYLKIRTDSFAAFCKVCNKIAEWNDWERRLYSLIRWIYPLAAFWLSYRRRIYAKRLYTFIDFKYDNSFLPSSRARSLMASLKFDACSRSALAWIDILDYDSEQNLDQIKLPCAFLFGGDGGYHSPYFVDPRDQLILEVGGLIGNPIVWMKFLDELNAHIRSIRRLYVPETIGPTLTLLLTKNKEVFEQWGCRVEVAYLQATTGSEQRLGIAITPYADPSSFSYGTPRIGSPLSPRIRSVSSSSTPPMGAGSRRLSASSRTTPVALDGDSVPIPYSGIVISSVSDPIFHEVRSSEYFL
eukprot:TRINITY_DN2716_c0_g1_i5.p1 TRINITY_DN2716_c0_g1~~TRINITY_DN2716_c0_g1_i5.p1  ORF type:complete len:1699 (-),score=247.88 TRINITY_DN2716_c0_g1_i5:958-6054(-)